MVQRNHCVSSSSSNYNFLTNLATKRDGCVHLNETGGQILEATTSERLLDAIDYLL